MATITPEPQPSDRFPTVADLLDEMSVPANRILMTPTPGTATLEDLLSLCRTEKRLLELVDGVLVEKAMGFYQSSLAGILIYFLWDYLENHPIGIVGGADGMIRLGPQLVRIPDVSFIRWDQFPGNRVGREPAPSLSPDLAVEVLSESNTRAEMARKLQDYFGAGSRLVWYLDPETRKVRVYTSVDQVTVLDESGILDGGGVLPGFRLSVGEWLRRAEGPTPPAEVR